MEAELACATEVTKSGLTESWEKIFLNNIVSYNKDVTVNVPVFGTKVFFKGGIKHLTVLVIK